MKHFFLAILLLTNIQLVFSQKYISTHKLAPFKEGDKYGYKNTLTGDIVIPAIYQEVKPFKEDLAVVKQNNMYGCIDMKGKLVIPFKYEMLFSFDQERALFKSLNKYGFIDYSGKEVIPAIYDRAKFFERGLVAVNLNNKWGYVDKNNNLVVPIKYDNIGPFFDNELARVNICDEGDNKMKCGKWGFVDTLGKEVIPLIYESADGFVNNKARVTLNKEQFYIDRSGQRIDTFFYGKNEKVGKYKNIRGFNMYYEIYGMGKPLLMIHGNGGSLEDFKYQIGYFSKNFKVIAVDSRAQGKSVDSNDSLSYEMMADDFNVLLDSLQIESCYVLGWSDGGINGLLLAIRHPGKVEKLAITGANLWPDTTAVDPYIYKMIMQQNESINDPELNEPHHKTSRKLLHLLSYEPHIKTEMLNGIKCPTLVIGGDHDVILPRHTMLIAESIPKSYLWIIPNSGHSTPIAKKDQFNSVVDEFFKALYFREIKEKNRFN